MVTGGSLHGGRRFLASETGPSPREMHVVAVCSPAAAHAHKRVAASLSGRVEARERPQLLTARTVGDTVVFAPSLFRLSCSRHQYHLGCHWALSRKVSEQGSGIHPSGGVPDGGLPVSTVDCPACLPSCFEMCRVCDRANRQRAEKGRRWARVRIGMPLWMQKTAKSSLQCFLPSVSQVPSRWGSMGRISLSLGRVDRHIAFAMHR